MDAIYPVTTEQIGKPDPPAPDYVGTYSPPACYKMAAIDELSSGALSVTAFLLN